MCVCVEPQGFCSCLILNIEGSIIVPDLMRLLVLWQECSISKHAGGRENEYYMKKLNFEWKSLWVLDMGEGGGVDGLPFS